MTRDEILNGGAFCRTLFQAINKTATAAGSGDNTEVDGDWVDRELSDAGIAQSAKLVITYTAALEQDETLSFAVQMQDATDASGAGAADVTDHVKTSTVVATGNSGGSTETGTVEVDIELAAYRQFLRAQITPDLSRGGTDTCEWSAALVLFGDAHQPVTQAIATLGGADSI